MMILSALGHIARYRRVSVVLGDGVPWSRLLAMTVFRAGVTECCEVAESRPLSWGKWSAIAVVGRRSQSEATRQCLGGSLSDAEAHADPT